VRLPTFLLQRSAAAAQPHTGAVTGAAETRANPAYVLIINCLRARQRDNWCPSLSNLKRTEMETG
jgi:hypothetical protein